MAEVFTSLKAEVIPVSDSEKAAELVDQEKFDGIFLDLEMPNMNGFDLARRIRTSSWNKSVPIVIVTGRDDRRTMQEAFAIGATFFLQKPVDRQRLTGLFRAVRGALLRIGGGTREFPSRPGWFAVSAPAWGELTQRFLRYYPCRKFGSSEIRKRSEHLPRKLRADRYPGPLESLEMASGWKPFRNEAMIIRYDYRREARRAELRIAN